MPAGKFPDTITYWGPGEANEYGVTAFDAPIAVNGRWQDRNETVRTTSGDEVTSSAVVFLDREVVEGGYLLLGASADPSPTNAGAREVQAVARTRDMRNVGEEVRAYL